MSIWGKVIGGVAGFALGGPLGAILGAAAGHAVDRMRGEDAPEGPISDEAKQVAFTVAVITLSAKMAKADGQVTRDEVDAFKEIFNIPPQEMAGVGRLFDEAKQETEGFEPYAQQVAHMFAHDRAVLQELLGGLYHIARADGVVHPAELGFLRRVADIFGFDDREFESILHGCGGSAQAGATDADAYKTLGVSPDVTDDAVKKAYRDMVREYHPDKLVGQGLPQEFIDLANERMAAINAAYDKVSKARGIK